MTYKSSYKINTTVPVSNGKNTLVGVKVSQTNIRTDKLSAITLTFIENDIVFAGGKHNDHYSMWNVTIPLRELIPILKEHGNVRYFFKDVNSFSEFAAKYGEVLNNAKVRKNHE